MGYPCEKKKGLENVKSPMYFCPGEKGAGFFSSLKSLEALTARRNEERSIEYRKTGGK